MELELIIEDSQIFLDFVNETPDVVEFAIEEVAPQETTVLEIQEEIVALLDPAAELRMVELEQLQPIEITQDLQELELEAVAMPAENPNHIGMIVVYDSSDGYRSYNVPFSTGDGRSGVFLSPIDLIGAKIVIWPRKPFT